MRRLLAFVIAALALCTCSREPTVIKFGSVSPLTGPQAEMGQDLANGQRLAVEEANARGGVLGKTLELVVMDDMADPKEAVSAANKLVSDPGVVAVVGHLNSGATIPASTIYNAAGVCMITPAATNPKVTQQGFRSVFRACITDAVQGPIATDFAIDTLGTSSMCVLHDKTAYGQGLAEQFRDRALERGVDVLMFEGIIEGDRDFSAVLTRIKALAPDLIYFGGMYPEGGLLVKQARNLGVEAVFMTGDGCYNPEFMEIGGPESEGAIVSFLAPPWEDQPQAAEFVARFKQRFGQPVKTYAPFGYDCVNILIAAIDRTGKADKASIIEAMREPGFRHDGVIGRTEFDEHGDTKNVILYFYVVKEGRLVPYGS
jgi:branched-chain amino acid transport system substrate-binding protein